MLTQERVAGNDEAINHHKAKIKGMMLLKILVPVKTTPKRRGLDCFVDGKRRRIINLSSIVLELC